MNIWDWVYDSVAGDDSASRARRELYSAHRRASRLCDDDPRGAIAILEGAIARARQLDEPWWELFLEHWRLQFLLTRARDPRAALPIAARCALEARKPLYATFPQRVCLHEDLITAYADSDPVGNAELIRGALDYMDGEIAPGAECRMCHAGLRADFLLTTLDAGALDAAHAYMALSEAKDSDHFRAWSALTLCRVLWSVQAEQAASQLESLSASALQSAKSAGCDEAVPELKMWRALGAQLNGRPGAARLYRLALDARHRYGGAPGSGYYVAALGVREQCGDLPGALAVIEAELDEISGTGQTHRETVQRLKKCALLRATQQDYGAEIERARSLAGALKNADWVERELTELEK